MHVAHSLAVMTACNWAGRMASEDRQVPRRFTDAYNHTARANEFRLEQHRLLFRRRTDPKAVSGDEASLTAH